MKEIETLESRVVYQNKWMSVREDKIRRASGVEGIFGVVDKADFVVILPIMGRESRRRSCCACGRRVEGRDRVNCQ